MKHILLAAASIALTATLAPAQTTYIPFSYPDAAGGKTLLTGVRGISGAASDQVYISGFYAPVGSSVDQGLLYEGSITSNTGTWHVLNYPGVGGETITSTALYGPNNFGTGVRVVGNYTTSTSGGAIGLMYEGPANGVGGTWTSLQYPGSINTIAHSNYGNLAVGNYDTQLDEGKAFVYNISDGTFSTLTFDGITPTSWTAYGIWQNPNGSYTITGGFSLDPSVTGLDQGYIVDYDAATGTTSNFRAYNYGNNPVTSVVSHFDGITSDGNGGFNLTGDWIGVGEAEEGGLGFFAHVGRNLDGSFTEAEWLPISYPGEGNGPTSGNTVYENYVLGIYVPDGGVPQGYVATVPEPGTIALLAGAAGLSPKPSGSRFPTLVKEMAPPQAIRFMRTTSSESTSRTEECLRATWPPSRSPARLPCSRVRRVSLFCAVGSALADYINLKIERVAERLASETIC